MSGMKDFSVNSRYEKHSGIYISDIKLLEFLNILMIYRDGERVFCSTACCRKSSTYGLSYTVTVLGRSLG